MDLTEEAERIIGRLALVGLVYRAVLPGSRELAEIICGFANADGGLLVLGASESDGRLVFSGLSSDFRTEAILSKALDLLTPRPTLHQQEIYHDRKRLHVIKIEKSSTVVTLGGVTYAPSIAASTLGGLVPQTTAAAHKGKVDFAILTIRDDEFQAVLTRFPPAVRATGRRIYNIHQLGLPGGGEYSIATLKCIEPGNTEALDAARDVLEELDPRWLLVVGIAGGVPSDEYTLGDVIVSTRIVDFSVEAVLQGTASEYALMGGPIHKDAASLAANMRALGNELGDWGSPSSVRMARPSLEVDNGEYYGDADWQRRVRSSLTRQSVRSVPLVTAGPIGSSDRLIKDTQLLSVLLKFARQVLAVEMESAGVYRAANGRGVPFLAIRGLSDVVGFKRDPRWTEYACHTAAALTRALLLTRPIAPRSI